MTFFFASAAPKEIEPEEDQTNEECWNGIDKFIRQRWILLVIWSEITNGQDT